ncbi:hypothetical protein ACQU0X_26565 [Pseudovibrio ascidiaceicola]|uniref:hypothetical protein n=1 Tax=Pseudovibrio ascidiaceicola TaxID=285279 RepID=UPI003D362270
MRLFLRCLPILAGCLLPQAAAALQDPCTQPDYTNTRSIQWFLGAHPMDGLIGTWCRLQPIPGNLDINLLFPYTKAHQTFKTDFAGARKRHGPYGILKMVQKVLPKEKRTSISANGIPFAQVLKKLTQLAANETPQGTMIRMSESHPDRGLLFLEEPLVIRIKPVKLSGVNFTLNAVLVPNLGYLALMRERKVSTYHFYANKAFVPGATLRSCESTLPYCKDMPKEVPFFTPWILDQVVLRAEGQSLTAPMNQIYQRYLRSLKSVAAVKTRHSINLDEGRASILANDKQTEFTLTANGGPTGTNFLELKWQAKQTGTYLSDQLRQIWNDYRIRTAPVTQP